MKAPSPSVQMLRRGTIINCDYEPAASPKHMAVPFILSKTPAEGIRHSAVWPGRRRILRALGKSELEIEALKDEGAR